MSRFLQVGLLALGLALAGCGGAKTEKQACTSTDECDSGLTCSIPPVASVSGCGAGGMQCLKACTTNFDCATGQSCTHACGVSFCQ